LLGQGDARADDEALHGLRHGFLSRTGKIADALGDAHGSADHIVGPDLDLTGVTRKFSGYSVVSVPGRSAHGP
jgi:hypothetical protein